MEIQIQLFIQEHHNSFYSIEVVGESELRLYTPDLEQGLEDFHLLLSDRIERLHPGQQHRYATPPNQTLESVEVPEVLKVEGWDGLEQHPTTVSVVVTRDRKWQRLWFPRWGCHYWISSNADLKEEVCSFLQQHLLKKMGHHERLTRRHERKEWLELLELEATPPALDSFTDKHPQDTYLPAPTPKEEEDKDEEDEESEDKSKTKQNKKKRPPTPTLEKIGVPISRLAKEQELEHAYGRQKEVEDLLRLLQSPGGNAIVLLGPSGVGKTTLLNELAYHIRKPHHPKELRTRPIWFVDASRLIAGDGWFGDWQRQCLDVVQECLDAEVIWYVGDLLPLLDAGKSINSDQNVSFLLRPYLAGKRLTILGECSPRGWSQLELRDIGFARLFTPYRLEEPPEREIQRILKQVAQDLHEEKDITTHNDALLSALELSRRYSSDGSLLGNAIHFLRRMVDEAFLQNKSDLHRNDAVAQFCSETGLPPFLVRDDLTLDHEAIQLTFQQRLIGQPEAIRRMTDLVSMIKSGLSDLTRPLGSFLFVGPTGVGKTEMAKTLAAYLFGNQNRLIRFDMSEFVNPQSVHRFLGSSHEEGKLVSAIRRNPFSVLLLDEIEKAHPAIFDVLLQALGEARITDESGRVADFRNTVVIMTSNLGVGTLRKRVGFGDQNATQFREHFIAEAEQFFRPEFFNRIDYIIPFLPLQYEAISKITLRELDKFRNREGIRQRNIDLQLDDTIPQWLAERGVDPRYGARPLKRVIEQKLNAPLAQHLSTLQPDQHHHIQVQPSEQDALYFHNSSSTKRKDKSQTRSQLLQLLQHINAIRFQTQRWLQTSLYRELKQEIRLFDHLSQDKHFWTDRRMAEERMAHIKAGREIVKDLQSFQEQIASLEDLAYEAYYDRNPEPLEDLKLEIEHTESLLSQIELALYARNFTHPNHATLYLQPDQSAWRWMRQLLDTYLLLMHSFSWTLRIYTADKLSEADLKKQNIDLQALASERDHKKRKQQERQAKRQQRAEQQSNEQGPPKKTREKKLNTLLERLPYVWRPVGSYEPNKQDENDDRKRRERLLNDVFVHGLEDSPKALVFHGTFAGCLLAYETGLHQHIEQEQVQVKVLYQNHKITPFDEAAHPMDPKLLRELPITHSTKLLHPLDLDEQWSQQRIRVVHEGKRIAQDLGLGIHQYLSPRLEQIYRRFIRAHIYFSTFGPQGIQWFNRDE